MLTSEIATEIAKLSGRLDITENDVKALKDPMNSLLFRILYLESKALEGKQSSYVKPEENCLSCKHRLSKTYHTIRCEVWTERIRKHLLYKGEDVTSSLVGRMWCDTKCQHYSKVR